LTEWVLLTSGTTGVPKLVLHTLATLTAPIKPAATPGQPAVWSTFYDIRRYGGLQVFLRALLGDGSLVLSSAGESTSDFLARAGAHGVTHILGTPTHWWLALASAAYQRIAPRYVRLSGETADQAILDRLRAIYPGIPVVHAFASTEGGVAFEVGDGLAGFPARLVGLQGAEVELKVEVGTLRIRSARMAARYLGAADGDLVGPDGFVDTRDMVELRGERYYFIGRKDGVINVGGEKIYPEEVEAVIDAHPLVQKSLVRARKNSITGAIVVAEVVLNAGCGPGDEEGQALKQEILRLCFAKLSRNKVPATIQFVSSLPVTATGKIARRDA
jgi:acyl-coenzyme A synthetase/AMP-(fatty) acid ligase